MGMALDNLRGKRFGRLVVQRRVNYGTGMTHWYCVCDCGLSSIVRAGNLKTGNTRSCGCLKKESELAHLARHGGRIAVDISGHRFGRLRVVERAGSGTDGHAMWRCACDCGGAKVAAGHNLRGGRTRSCGCLRRDRVMRNGTSHKVAVRGAVLPGRNRPQRRRRTSGR